MDLPLMRRPSAAPVLVLGVLALAACDDPVASEPEEPGDLHLLVLVSGGGQTGEVGTPLEDEVVVQAIDDAGRAVPGVEVGLAAWGEGASLEPGQAVTDGRGLARGSWTLPIRSGPALARVSTSDGKSVGIEATALPGPPAELRAPDSASVATGARFRAPVRAFDRYDNEVGSEALEAARWRSSAPGVVATLTADSMEARGAGRAVVTVEEGALERSVVILVKPLGELIERRPVSVSYNHSCALDAGGGPWCWGSGGSGALGDGIRDTVFTPVPVRGGLHLVAITAAREHTCGLEATRRAWCWGANELGQLGDETHEDRLTPAAVAGGHVFRSLSAGDSHTCGITAAGEALCWGGSSSTPA